MIRGAAVAELAVPVESPGPEAAVGLDGQAVTPAGSQPLHLRSVGRDNARRPGRAQQPGCWGSFLTPTYGLKTLSADAEARRLAFVRERALRDERSLLKDAREEGRAEALRNMSINLIHGTDLSDAAIAAITGLGVADLAALRRAL